MNATILTKPIAVAILAGCVATFGIGLQFASFSENEAVAQRVVLDQGTGREGRGRSVPRPDAEVLDTIKVPGVMVVAQPSQSGSEIEVYDRKPRSASEIAIERALHGPLRSNGMQYHDVALEQVVEELASEYKIPIQIDRSALEDAGLGPDEPVTVNLHGISFRSGMRQLLRQYNLTYIVRDEVMVVTTPTAAEDYLETRVYPADDSFSRDNIKALRDLIVKHVDPESWIGGRAEISAFAGGFVVTQTYAGHGQVRDLLKQFGWPGVKQE